MALLPVLLVVALTVYALIDVWVTPEAEVLHLPPPTWVAVVVVVPVLGPVAWLVAGKRAGSPHASAAAPPDPPRQATPSPEPSTRLTIPDYLPDVGLDPDDPEDRWLIDQRDRQRAARAHRPGQGDAVPATTDDLPRPPTGPTAVRPTAPRTRPPHPRRPQSPDAGPGT